ncbi:MAG: T9SS type A sorting domain-containing protein [Bacteroidia bacterium]|nr:T9SS type A sorting domain-containing protein [Bacteroidia bacterium]
MKKIFTSLSLFLIFSTSYLYSQCALVPLTLNERVNAATVIIEGAVNAKRAYWDNNGSMILTANSISISKVFKGNQLLSGNTLDIITLGGQVGDKAVKVEPELELEIGDIGIFMLIKKDGIWVAESGPQGFISIDKHTANASDVFNHYPPFTIQSDIIGLVGQSPVNINPSITAVTISSKRASPTISSISPTTINAGTSSILTIKGSNFNSLIDTSSVQFKNGDDGGATFVKALKNDYVSWSDTMIKVRVRTKAGTGKIRVVVNGNGIVNSTDTLKIPYAHLNVVSGDTSAFETQEIGMNSSGGISWRMNQRFYDSAGARGAFVRSLERWRCGTFINWDTFNHVSHSNIKLDGVNMCAWDTSSSPSMPNGVLAQCFSFWSGCFNPNLQWFVNELDIRFRVRPTNSTNWNYTTSNATSNQFHFESVATHELGHGHQLGHVINSAVVMHYSIANGQTKPALNSNDIAGGNYVIAKSINSICGKTAHSKLNSNNCAIVAPNAHFIYSGLTCKNEFIKFTDSSQGNITAYAWNFGANASPASANTKGPHFVSYSNGGNKTVSLTITTLNGNKTENQSVAISTDSKIIPNFTFQAAEKGKLTFQNTANNPSAATWYFGNGDSAKSINTSYNYNTGGTYNITLKTNNNCNENDTTIPVKFAYLDFGVLGNTPCILENVTYLDSSDNNVNTWQWSFTGGNPASASGKGPHKVNYSSPGLKSASLTVSALGGPNQTYTRNNLVNVGSDTFTSANFIFGYYGKNIVGFDNKSTGTNKTYKWYFGDGDSSTEKNPVHAYTNANNKVVKLIVTGNCGTADTTINLRDFTTISTLQSDEFCTVIPNPANTVISANMPSVKIANFEMMDINGRLIISGTISHQELINISELEAGIYFLRINSGQAIQVIRLVVNH